MAGLWPEQGAVINGKPLATLLALAPFGKKKSTEPGVKSWKSPGKDATLSDATPQRTSTTTHPRIAYPRIDFRPFALSHYSIESSTKENDMKKKLQSNLERKLLRKTIFHGLLIVGIGLAGRVNASPFVDDFSTDTTGDYTHLNTFNSGGSFSINTTTATLTLNAANNNTSTITHDFARLAVGESFVMEVSGFTVGKEFSLFVSNQAAPPNFNLSGGSRNGFRFFAHPNNGWELRKVVDGSATNFVTTTSPVDPVPATSQALSMHIFRDTATDFRFGFDLGSGLQILDFASGAATHTGLGSDLWIGAEIFGRNGSGSITIDRLAIIPKPGGLLLSARGGVGGPFEPFKATETLKNENAHETDMVWSASIEGFNTEWLRLSSTGGTLSPGEQEDVEVEFDNSAADLSFGIHTAEVVFTTTIGADTETWTRGVMLTIENTFAIPYRQDFEDAAPGAPPAVLGWLTGTDDASGILAEAYAYTGGFPIPDTTHEQVLALDTRGEPVSVKINMREDEFPAVYLDTMVSFSPSPHAPFVGAATKIAVYMDDAGSLILFHGGGDGNGHSFTRLEGEFEIGQWYRLTIPMNFEGVDGHPFFQVMIDGDSLSAAGEGFEAPSLDPSDNQGGSWFRFANHDAQSPEERKRIHRVQFLGTGMIDDFVLTAANPYITHHFVRTVFAVGPHALMTAESGWMDPVGELVQEPFASYEIPVEAGEGVEITYKADAFHRIDSLYSGGVEVPLDSEQTEYTWSMDEVTGDVSNIVTFAASMHEGDGRTPEWWVNTLHPDMVSDADAGNTVLSLFTSYLINQENLYIPFAITGFGLNEENHAFFEWRSSGEVRGTVSVEKSNDLIGWQNIDGHAMHEAGVNTWTARDPAHEGAFDRVFYRLKISE